MPRYRKPQVRNHRKLYRYKVQTEALSETRFTEEGLLKEVGTAYTFFLSGRKKAARCEAGVEFAIKSHVSKKKGKRKVQGATITNRSSSQTPRGRENRQILTSTNRTNVRKALRLALSSPSDVIAIQKGLKNTRTK